MVENITYLSHKIKIYMQITFHGAAQTVTGSKHLITLENGTKILLDCGLFQGMGKETLGLNTKFGFDASQISYVLLSHAHIDHSGLLPKLYAEGFRGKIFSTPASIEIATALLADSAHIQASDVKFVNKKKEKKGLPLIMPLYTQIDAEAVCQLFSPIEYNSPKQIDDSVSVVYTEAGHILGSAAVHVTITENNKTTQITFSGDVGRYTDAILRQPATFAQADYILLESTYGDTLHDDFNGTEDALLAQIKHTCIDKKGSLIIPAFSVGRTQELIFALNALEIRGVLPKVPYYIDSPLSITMTEITKKYPKYYNDNAQDDMAYDKDVFNFPGLQMITTKQESMALNERKEPCVIISASGMAEAGRVKHHIANKIGNASNTIMLVGYCSPMGLGGRLKAGDKEVKIYTDMYEVKAEVASMRSMSAHGDYEDLIRFLDCQDKTKIKKLFLVHGEVEVQKHFAEKLNNIGVLNVILPKMHENFTLS
jgi:metallo-beta-lactamase family protein